MADTIWNKLYDVDGDHVEKLEVVSVFLYLDLLIFVKFCEIYSNSIWFQIMICLFCKERKEIYVLSDEFENQGAAHFMHECHMCAIYSDDGSTIICKCGLRTDVKKEWYKCEFWIKKLVWKYYIPV